MLTVTIRRNDHFLPLVAFLMCLLVVPSVMAQTDSKGVKTGAVREQGQDKGAQESKRELRREKTQSAAAQPEKEQDRTKVATRWPSAEKRWALLLGVDQYVR